MPHKPLTEQQKAAFGRLANALSPENLHEDGEVSMAQARRKKAHLLERWQTLEREVGRTVTEDELYDDAR